MARSVLLLSGMASDGPSMTRYARELFDALRELPDPSYAIGIEQPSRNRYVSRIVDHPHTRRLDSAWQRYVAYPRLVRRRPADVWHILDHSYAQLITQTDPSRTVVTCHDIIPLLAAERVIPMDIPKVVARTFRMRIRHMARARTVITASHATKTSLGQYTSVRADRIAVIPYGVSPSFRPIPEVRALRRRAAGVSDSTPIVLQVATAARYKNTSVLLRALARLRMRRPDVLLMRVGPPLLRDEATLADQLGVRGSIILLGSVSDRVLAEWYNTADVLVFPSAWEGFGWPPLEAMACGTPVVASNVPAVAEVAGDAALLVSPDDAAVAHAVERVLEDVALAGTLREKGRARAREFNWKRTALATAAVYDDLLQ